MELASRMIVSEKFEGLLERRRQGLKIRNGIVDEILKGYDVRGTEVMSPSLVDFIRRYVRRAI